MTVFLIGDMIGGFFETIFRDLLRDALSYDEKSFVGESSLGRREALDALREDVDTTVSIWPWSRQEKFLVGRVEEDRVKIGPGGIWTPILYGVVEDDGDGGSTRRGNFHIGNGATFVYGLIVVSLFTSMILIVFGLLPPWSICAWLSLSIFALLVGGVRISLHKRWLLGEIERRLSQSLDAGHR